MKAIYKNRHILFIALFFILIFSDSALCTVPGNDSLDIISSRFNTAASSWGTVLTGYAVNIFWILALIDFTWMAINLALNPGEFSDLAANLVRKIIFIGLFWTLVQPDGSGFSRGFGWAHSIVASMVNAGSVANSNGGGVVATPSDIFDTGLALCQAVSDAMSIMSPGTSIALAIGALVIMAVFALIAAMMLLVYVQSYIILYAGIIFLGFGGSAFSKDIALNYFRAALSIGAKLFVMILVVGIGERIIQEWTAVINITFTQVALYVGSSVVLLALVKAIPDMVGDLINGFSWGSGESLAHTGMKIGKGAVGAAVGGAVGAAGGAMAVKQAASLAKASGAKGFMGQTGATIANFGKAAMNDTAGGLSGRHWGQGTKGGRMASFLKKESLSSKPPEDDPYYSDAPDMTGSISKDNSRKK